MTEQRSVKLTRMASDGRALGRLDGKVVFVPYAIPGETVHLEIEREHSGWLQGRLRDVIEVSPDRVKPACSHFGPQGCGGCQWQHIGYAAQLHFKTEIVRDQFRRLGKFPQAPVAAALPVGEAFAYRNHVQLHISPEGPGYIRADQKGVLPIRSCPLMADRLARMFTELSSLGGEGRRIFIRTGLRSGEEIVVLELADGSLSNISGCGCIHEEVLGIRYRISASSFFQVNTMGAEALVTTVLEMIEPGGEDSILDLYSGVGLFSLALAQRVRSVVAVESYSQAVSDARCNLKAAGLENCRLIEGPVHDVLEELNADFGAVIVDPPRSGCGKHVMNQLAALHPARIVYVSCDPATLARDARYLADRGYCLSHVLPLDLFPQTFHVECAALFIAE